MKNAFYLSLMTLFIWGGMSCSDSSFLGETVTTDLDYETVFSDSTYTEGFLNEIYRQIGFDSRPSRYSRDNKTYGGLQTSSDEAEFRTATDVTADLQFATGTVNPVVITDDAWKISYENIRRANVFMTGVEKAPLTATRKTKLKAEARFLRAWYYSILLKHYGGIPLLGDDVYTEDDKMVDTRSTYDECLDYIIKECTLAAQDLPVKPSGREYGRIGGGACKALISRLRLYAASPLFNGNSDLADSNCPPELIGYPEASIDRWRLAVESTYEVTTLGYDLYERHTDPKNGNAPDPGHGFYAVFLAADADYRPGSYIEPILEEMRPSSADRERWFQPPSRNGAKCGFVYQNLVDAFPMKNGKAITDPTSGYDANDPYKDRDPRFYNTVVHDQTLLQDLSGRTPVNIYLRADGTSSGRDAVYTGTPTGYYINKMVNRHIAGNSVHGGAQGRSLIRYGEIVLNYAEATNEYAIAQTGLSTIVPNSDIAYEQLMKIRKRGGIEAGANNMYGLKANMTREEMREAIRYERRIELAIEGHRFWDVRRWKIADQTENQVMKGMEVHLTADGGRKYTEFTVRKREFRKAMYFWPIPYNETTKMPGIIQNPHYNL